MKKNLRKLKKLSKEIGYKPLNVQDSTDHLYLIINNKKYLKKDVIKAYVNVSLYESFEIPVDETADYNVLSGYLGYKIFDHPLGLLTGIELEKIYEEKTAEKVELIVNLKDQVLTLTTGIFLSEDPALQECIQMTQNVSDSIMNYVKDYKYKRNNVKFEYLKLSFEKSLTNRILIIKRENDQLHLILRKPSTNKDELNIMIEDKGFSNKIESYQISRWNKRYVSETGDGIQWYIDYKEKDKAEKNIYGYNAYPIDWFELLNVLKELHPKIKKFILKGINDTSEKDTRNAFIFDAIIQIVLAILKIVAWFFMFILFIIFGCMKSQRR